MTGKIRKFMLKSDKFHRRKPEWTFDNFYFFDKKQATHNTQNPAVNDTIKFRPGADTPELYGR